MQLTKSKARKAPDIRTLTLNIVSDSDAKMKSDSRPINRKTGKELERAVHFIQQTLLNSDPKLKGTGFTIESRKITETAGVHHEADVLVKTLPDTPYRATWVFECKDRKEPVGKNDVIILGEKVRALAASRGFLVARQITKDAQAQINLDPRLAFLPVTENFLSPLSSLELVHASYDLLPIRIKTKERGVPAKDNPDVLEWQNCKCVHDQKPIDFLEFVEPFVDEIVFDEREKTAPRLQQAGTHFEKRARMLEFEPGEFLLNGADLEYMIFEVQFFVAVERQKLISKFELKNQGRHFSFAPINDILPGKSLQIDLVERL